MDSDKSDNNSSEVEKQGNETESIQGQRSEIFSDEDISEHIEYEDSESLSLSEKQDSEVQELEQKSETAELGQGQGQTQSESGNSEITYESDYEEEDDSADVLRDAEGDEETLQADQSESKDDENNDVTLIPSFQEKGQDLERQEKTEEEEYQVDTKEGTKEADIDGEDRDSLTPSHLDTHRSTDPIMSDDDDSDQLAVKQKEAQQTKAHIQDVISVSDISEIPEQEPLLSLGKESLSKYLDDATKDRESSSIYKDDFDDDDLVNQQDDDDDIEPSSLNEDNEFNISMDHYMDFPRASSSRSTANKDPVGKTLFRKDSESVVSDIFEPRPASSLSGTPQPSYSRFDDLQSRYTRPRPLPHHPEDLSLTYLPARGVRSYSPFLKSSPLAEFYRGDKVSPSEMQNDIK